MICIIMPVFNTEEYLEETIESIIQQSLPFRDNVKLHMLDDASTDGSLAICRRYEEMYPDNITVTHFDDNRGVSSIRNYALDKYRNEKDAVVGFIDSDDKLAPDALLRTKEFLDSHKDVNVAVMEIMYFGIWDREHRLNWRFAEREVVRIRKDFDFPQYYIGGTFMRGSALEILHFDETMSFWEDALAINQVILMEEKYGLIRGAFYYYRKRESESSLVDQAWRDKEHYSKFLEEGYGRMMDYCRKKKFRLLPYVQFLVAFHLRIYMMNSKSDVVNSVLDTDEDMDEFRERVRKILKHISVKVITSLPTTLPIIETMLTIKKGKDVRARRTYENNDCVFSYRGREIARMAGRSVKLYYIMTKPGYEGMWRGRFCTPAYAMRKGDYIYAEHNGEKVIAQRYKCRKKLYILGRRMRKYINAGFVIAIPPEWDKALFGIYMAEGDVNVPLNEIVFAEVEQRQIGQQEDSRFLDNDNQEES